MPGKRWLFAGFLAFLFLLLYGSLVPLDFRYIPPGHALGTFQGILSGDFTVASRVDLSSNILLTVPITFFLTGLIWPAGKRLLSVCSSVFAILATLVFTVGIEFAQLYVPGRTPSQSDVVAQIIGATLGCLSWWFWGQNHWPRFFANHGHRLQFSKAEAVFYLYLLVMFGYNLLPLDITLNPADIYHKWTAGRIIILPFSYPYPSLADALYELVTDIALWVPVTLLLIHAKAMTAKKAWLITLYIAVLLELLQLLIYTRITDFTDIITAVIGASFALLVLSKMGLLKARHSSPQPTSQQLNLFLTGIALVAAWSVCLALIFWFPYDFNLDGSAIRAKLKGFSELPFYIYYRNSIYMAITTTLQKLFFFLPLGGALWVLSLALLQYVPRALLFMLALGLCAGAAFVIELGQLALPGKVVDSTDLILQTLGGIAGYWIADRLFLPWYRNQYPAGLDPDDGENHP